MPLVSIIIPCYKDNLMAIKLIAYLQSITSDSEVEILLSVPEVCKSEYKESQLNLVTSPYISRASQMNVGAASAKGDIFVFLHADVIPPKGFISLITCALNNHYEAGFFSYQFDKNNFFLKINAAFTKRDGLFAGGGDQCLFMTREIFFDLNGFDEKYVIMEDFDFTRRLRKKGIKYQIIKNDLIVSARKYEKNSYLKVNIVNLFVFVLFTIRMSPQRIKSIYGKLLQN